MRDPARIDVILKRLSEIWKKNPDLRLGQLLVGANSLTTIPLFYTEDEALLDDVQEKFGG